MKNYISEGKNKQFTAAANVKSGEVVVVGDLVCVSTADVESGKSGIAVCEGIFLLPKKSADNISDGVKVYWDAVAKEITTTASGNKAAGYADGATAATVLEIAVKLGR